MESITLGTMVAAIPAAAASPMALAVLSALGALCAMLGISELTRPGLVAQRLGTFGERTRTLEELELQQSFRDRVLAPAVRFLSGLVMRLTPGSTLEGYRRKLVLAGNPGGLEVRDFLGIKGLLALVLGVGSYVALAGMTRLGPAALVLAILPTVMGFYLPNVILTGRVKRRQKEIQRALPDTLDLLTICVESGLGFDSAMSRVAEKREDELAREVGRMLSEMRVGRSRRDSLKSMVERTDVQDVNTFVSAIVQSEQLGVPISKVLFTQAEQMRVRRRQRAEEAAHKAPIKMLFPMVFLIFPSIFFVILGPALPQIMKTLGST